MIIIRFFRMHIYFVLIFFTIVNIIKNIQTYNNGNSSNTFNVGGNTKQIPDGRGTKSNASRISDVRSYAPNSAVNNTISDIVDEVI